jgi:DNA polymerase-3 subunit delta
MNFAQFRKTLSSGSLDPVLLFHGDEPFLARMGVDLLKRSVLTEGSEEFDFASFWGKEVDAETVAATASTVPMLSEKRLTVVYEVDQLRPQEKKKLLKFVQAPGDMCCLALVSFRRLTKRTTFERGLLAASRVVSCDALPPPEAQALVGEMATGLGKEIDGEAASLLVRWTDARLEDVANELDKLCSFVGDRNGITPDDVGQVVGVQASTLSDLTSAVAARDKSRALGLAVELLEGGLDAAQLVSQLFAHWMLLWRRRATVGRVVSAGGRSTGGVGQRDRLDASAAARTSKEYASAIELFYRADRQIRLGRPPGPIVAMLVYELCADITGSR